MAARKKKATPAPAPAPVVSPVVTMTAFVERAATVSARRVAGAGCDSVTQSDDWAGASFEAAVHMGRCGWPEGVAAVRDAISAVGGIDIAPAWEIDVAGAFCCAPAFITGSPDCMFARTVEETERRRIALVYPLSVSFTVTVEERMRYAAALARVVADTIAGGAEIAVYGMTVTRQEQARFVTGFEARAFGDPLDLDRLAFAFHPAMHRRLTFAYLETLEGFQSTASGNYGYPQRLTLEDCVAAGVALDPAAVRVMPAINSTSSTQDYIEAMRATIQAAQ